jgi:xanthine dehydrogenase accessory factor
VTLHRLDAFGKLDNPRIDLKDLSDLFEDLQHAPAVLVWVQQAQGSVPRDAGTWMAVFAAHQVGTIGGGHLEHQAIAQARAVLQDPAMPLPEIQRVALGPSLGQCCGGVLALGFERVSAADLPRLQLRLAQQGRPLALFGGGHVGQALVKVLADLPFQVRWIDSRDEIFPADVPDGVDCEHSNPVQAAVADLAPGSRVLIMSFSHAEDLDIVVACLKRLRAQDDLPFVGLIGSQTKWATFRHRLEERGFAAEEIARITCPIGVPGIAGKEPEVIAVAVAAQLLQTL